MRKILALCLKIDNVIIFDFYESFKDSKSVFVCIVASIKTLLYTFHEQINRKKLSMY